MTFDIGLHEVCVRVGVLYVITKFSRMDIVYQIFLPMVLRSARALRTRGAPLKSLFVLLVINNLLSS